MADSAAETQTARDRLLITGNDAAGWAAIRAGCRYYYGYPITPQSELTEYMARHMPECGGTFIQSESELAAISMVHGSAAAGARAMTSSSSPGISLKMEGISYIAGSELPAVIINVQRGGPGLGDIRPSQADYFQAVKGGGHGDYRLIVLAPSGVQEVSNLVFDAFDLADRWRNPVMILMDGRLGQMMEPIEIDDSKKPLEVDKPWALTGAEGRARNVVKSFFSEPGGLEEHNLRLQKKYCRIAETEVRCEEVRTADARVIIVAYGTCARLAKEVLYSYPEDDCPVGLIRPITLWPFPTEEIRALAGDGVKFLAVEMSAGQMVEDVRLAVEGRAPVHLLGRTGGAVPGPRTIAKHVRSLLGA